jgi:esterase/lipase
MLGVLWSREAGYGPGLVVLLGLSIVAVLALLLADGLPVKQASKLAAAITGAAKNALYERALALKQAA